MLIIPLIILVTAERVDAGSKDSVQSRTYNNPVTLYVGIGLIEMLNLGVNIQTYKGIYINTSIGIAAIQGIGGFLPVGGKFIKIGTCWKMWEEKFTPTITFDVGESFLDAEPGLSDKAFLTSVLAGIENRADNGFDFFLKAGERFSSREKFADRYLFGLQIGCGWNF
jgi:hypothetical protein